MGIEKIIEYLNQLNLPNAPFEIYLVGLLFLTTSSFLAQFFVWENIFETRFKNTETPLYIYNKLKEHEINGEIDMVLYWFKVLELTNNQSPSIILDSYIFSIKLPLHLVYSPTYKKFLPIQDPYRWILYRKDLNYSENFQDSSIFFDSLIYYWPFIQQTIGLSLGWLLFLYFKKHFLYLIT